MNIIKQNINILISLFIMVLCPMTGKANLGDKFLWLEDDNDMSIKFVKELNEKTLSYFDSKKNYKPIQSEIEKIIDKKDNLQTGSIVNGLYYNVLKDSEHPRGVLRRTRF